MGWKFEGRESGKSVVGAGSVEHIVFSDGKEGEGKGGRRRERERERKGESSAQPAFSVSILFSLGPQPSR